MTVQEISYEQLEAHQELLKVKYDKLKALVAEKIITISEYKRITNRIKKEANQAMWGA